MLPPPQYVETGKDGPYATLACVTVQVASNFQWESLLPDLTLIPNSPAVG